MVGILKYIVVQIFFGPWFAVESMTDTFNAMESRRHFFLDLIFLLLLIAVFAASIIAARRKKREIGHFPAKSRLVSVLLLVFFAIGILGGLSNVLVIALNGYEMPVVGSAAYECPHLRLLTDHISYYSSGIVRFLFPRPGWYVSPGDLLLAVWFNCTWWLCLALIAFGVRKSICR